MQKLFRFLKNEIIISLQDFQSIRSKTFIFIFNLLPSFYALRAFNNLFLLLAGIRLESIFFTYIKSGLHAENAKNVSIGKGCFINNNLYIEGKGKVSIGKAVQIGPNVKIFTTNHLDRSKDEVGSVSIGDGAWIGGGGNLPQLQHRC